MPLSIFIIREHPTAPSPPIWAIFQSISHIHVCCIPRFTLGPARYKSRCRGFCGCHHSGWHAWESRRARVSKCWRKTDDVLWSAMIPSVNSPVWYIPRSGLWREASMRDPWHQVRQWSCEWGGIIVEACLPMAACGRGCRWQATSWQCSRRGAGSGQDSWVSLGRDWHLEGNNAEHCEQCVYEWGKKYTLRLWLGTWPPSGSSLPVAWPMHRGWKRGLFDLPLRFSTCRDNYVNPQSIEKCHKISGEGWVCLQLVKQSLPPLFNFTSRTISATWRDTTEQRHLHPRSCPSALEKVGTSIYPLGSQLEWQ